MTFIGVAGRRLADIDKRGKRMGDASEAGRRAVKHVSRLFAAVLVILGVVLAVGGVWLIGLRGSPYYLLAGASIAVSGVLLWRGRALGAIIYGAFFLVTVAWSIWEAGFDAWALAPRLAFFAALGLFFLTPIGAPAPGFSFRGGVPRLAAGLVGAVLVGWLLHAATGQAVVDPAFARGVVPAPAAPRSGPATAADGEWPVWGATPGGTRFSQLNQLTPANVKDLQVAWRYHVGPGVDGKIGNLEATPIKIGDKLYLCTGYNDVIALDAETGKQAWRYRSGVDRKGFKYNNCRGVAYYRAPGLTGPCATRIISMRYDGYLIALDAETGAPCSEFGEGGRVSLLKGMPKADPGYYLVSSAPTIVRGKVVVGGWVADGQYWGEPSGVIRAFDAVTGQFAWAFDMGRPGRTGEPAAGETYTPSTPNSWAPMSADEELGLVYAPTGSSVPDYFGGQRRPFDDKYSTSTVAIDVETGQVRWSFQIVHHDLWDYDLASQPTLVDLPGPNGVRKAVVQPTKRGDLFVLDRETGKPIMPVVERPTPQDGLAPGERLSPTQPFSIGMPSLAGPSLTEKMMWGITPIDQLLCRIQFRSHRYEGVFTPPSLQKTLVDPGNGGGMNWGSVSVDPQRGLLVANTMRQPFSVRLLPRAEVQRRSLKPMSKANTSIGYSFPQANTPYGAESVPFFGPLGVPCQQPPYGMVSAIDLTSGKLVWTRPVGNGRNVGPLGFKTYLPLPMGLHMVGGSIMTRGGLVFMGATMDSNFRAFDAATGKTLWQTDMPASGNANPMTYVSQKSGRQFVVIAAGNDIPAAGAGDHVIAYALPKQQ